MARSVSRLRFVTVSAAVMAMACLLVGARAEAAVQGRAFAAFVNVPSEGVSPTTLVDSGELPPTGGVLGDSAAVAIAGTVVWLIEPASRTEGDECRGSSRSVMSGGYLLPGKPAAVTFDGITSHDNGECCHHENPRFHTSDIANLYFAGALVPVTGEPNQIVDVPGVGTLIINEIIPMSRSDCDNDDYQVNALDLKLAGGEQVVVASARFNSDHHCCGTLSKISSWGELKSYYR